MLKVLNVYALTEKTIVGSCMEAVLQVQWATKKIKHQQYLPADSHV